MFVTSWLRQLENSPLAFPSHGKLANNILDGGIPTTQGCEMEWNTSFSAYNSLGVSNKKSFKY